MGQCMNTENKYFVSIEQLKQILQQEYGMNVEEAWIDELCRKFIIIMINQGDNRYIYNTDIEVCRRLYILNEHFSAKEIEAYEYYGNVAANMLKISEGTILLYEHHNDWKALPVFVRNIVMGLYDDIIETCEPTVFEILGVTILTTNKSICRYIEGAVYRKFQLDRIKTSDFANSSSYLGSKKKIVGFIVEAVFAYGNNETIYLDIMCGSGAVSNAFAQSATVYASDAQEFCRVLAKMQGKGIQESEAVSLIKSMYVNYNWHLEIMEREFAKPLLEEERIMHLDLKDRSNVLKQYMSFIENFELYSSDYVNSEKLEEIVRTRKKSHTQIPYCLFTYYYTNVYFGLSQCIQIDSIRYAVDQIEDERIKEWALGALVATVSSVGTTHVGYFAQPKRLDEGTLTEILRKRARSVWHEFSRRLIAIAQESERYPYSVKTLEGPWKKALTAMKQICDKNVIVYLDAPYKRDEYSRYYHVLETLVKYDYPESENKGRMRSKKTGERFITEFFTKNIQKVEECFEKIILEVLEKGYVCVWSYSDNGCASIVNVVTRVKEQFDCEVYFYGMPHNHNPQRKKSKRISVIEYCMVFRKENNN